MPRADSLILTHDIVSPAVSTKWFHTMMSLGEINARVCRVYFVFDYTHSSANSEVKNILSLTNRELVDYSFHHI